VPVYVGTLDTMTRSRNRSSTCAFTGKEYVYLLSVGCTGP